MIKRAIQFVLPLALFVGVASAYAASATTAPSTGSSTSTPVLKGYICSPTYGQGCSACASNEICEDNGAVCCYSTSNATTKHS